MKERKDGKEIGKKEGIKEGRIEAKIDIAKKLIEKGMKKQEICDITGLEELVVEKLIKDN